MTRTIYCLTALLCALCLAISSQNTARAADQGIVATVNDIPITSFDIDQRLRLLEIMGNKQSGDGIRKKALDMMIDEIIIQNCGSFAFITYLPSSPLIG